MQGNPNTAIEGEGKARRTRRVPPVVVAGAALLAAMVVVALLIQRPDFESKVLEFDGEAMGSTYHIKVVDPSFHAGTREALARGVAGELDLVNSTMSRFDPDSELSRFNGSRGDKPFIMSKAAIEVVAAARRMSEKSAGAYDVTVLPLLRLWGFAGGKRRTAMPTPEEIDAARAHVGWRLVEVDEDALTLRKLDPAVEIDLGSIAPGAAVDRLAEMFEAFKYEDYMVEVGGEIRAHGARPDGTPWRIGIEKPIDGKRTVGEIVPLRNRSMTTSGDYRQFYVLDGQRFSHTIDPRTGRPVAHGLASVTVLQEECMAADAWATALDVLGPDDGFELAEREGIPALFIVRDKDGAFSERATKAFEKIRAEGLSKGGEPEE